MLHNFNTILEILYILSYISKYIDESTVINLKSVNKSINKIIYNLDLESVIKFKTVRKYNYVVFLNKDNTYNQIFKELANLHINSNLSILCLFQSRKSHSKMAELENILSDIPFYTTNIKKRDLNKYRINNDKYFIMCKSVVYIPYPQYTFNFDIVVFFGRKRALTDNIYYLYPKAKRWIVSDRCGMVEIRFNQSEKYNYKKVGHNLYVNRSCNYKHVTIL